MDELDNLLSELKSSVKEKEIVQPRATVTKPRSATKSNTNHLEAAYVQTYLSSHPHLRDTLKTCCQCHIPILKGEVNWNGKNYHTEHFECCVCRTSLAGRLCFDRDGQLYCETDYHSKFSPNCAYCHQSIAQEPVIIGETAFHRNHFFCCHCGCLFDETKTYRVHDGKAYCEEDYCAFFVPNCEDCKKPVTNEFIELANKIWHPSCLKCKECQVNLAATGAYDYEGEPHCETHYYSKSDSVCYHCKKPVIGRCIIAMNQKYHPNHFICSFCQNPLEAKGFKDYKGKPYCSDCFIKLF